MKEEKMYTYVPWELVGFKSLFSKSILFIFSSVFLICQYIEDEPVGRKITATIKYLNLPINLL